MNSPSTVYLNGEFLPHDEAKISVMDRGFLLGDGVYEVIPAFNSHPFRLDEHLNRLQRSLDQIQIPDPLTRHAWQQMITDLIQRNGGGNQSIYFQVTRGVSPVRDHIAPQQIKPTIFAMSNPIKPHADSVYQTGIAMITMEDIRWHRCDIKAISLLANVLARTKANDENAAEAVLIRDGYVTEGAASTVFIVQQGILKTPAQSDLILPGITRDLILELANANDIPAIEDNITEEALQHCDEIWLSSSVKEILPVTTMNHQPIANGKPGLVWQKMHSLYQQYKTSYQPND